MRISGVNSDIFTSAAKVADDTKQADDVEVQESSPAFIRKKRPSEEEKLEEMRSQYQNLFQQLEASRTQGEAMSNEIETRRKCMIIAMRIMCGDKVPPEDYKYLAEKDIGLYGKAILMRIQKENQKEHERVSEDEEASVDGGTEESASVESIQPAVDESGGEIQSESSGDSAPSPE